ncbi:MAG: hypothetical protein RSA41_06285 [Christensenella sp.]
MIHDKDYFRMLSESIITWALIAMLCIFLITVVGLPLALSLFLDWRWIFAYLAYPVLLFLAACLCSCAKNGDDDESH